jgi:hypothetical protein
LAVGVNVSHWDELDGLYEGCYAHFGRVDVSTLFCDVDEEANRASEY